MASMERKDLLFDLIGALQVVGIDRCDEICLGLGNTSISGGGYSSVALTYKPYTAILRGVARDDLGGCVPRAVVDNQYLQMTMCLRSDAR